MGIPLQLAQQEQVQCQPQPLKIHSQADRRYIFLLKQWLLCRSVRGLQQEIKKKIWSRLKKSEREIERPVVCFLRHSLQIWSEGEHNTEWCLLTCRCLSVIDKSWDHVYLNVKPGCFSPIRITVWSGFAGWNHMKTNPRASGAHELQQHIFFFFFAFSFSETLQIIA